MSQRATHIILLPVRKSSIVDSIRDLQKNIIQCANVESRDQFEKWMTHKTKLHISLALIHVEDHQLDKAKAAFNEFWEESKDKLAKYTKEIVLNGIDRFTSADDVLYAKVEDPEWITKMANILRDVITKYGFVVDIRREFKAHVTICQIDRNFKDKMSYPQEMWQAYKYEDFGFQQFRTVEFLARSNPNHPGENEKIDSRTLKDD